MNSGSFSASYLPIPENDFAGLAAYFVNWFLKRFPFASHHADDLRQEAAIGALRAVPKFDPRRGVAFKVFAWWRMRNQVARFLRQLPREEPSPLVADTSFKGSGGRGDEFGIEDWAHEAAPARDVQFEASLVLDPLRRVLFNAMSERLRALADEATGKHPHVEFFIGVLGGESVPAASRRFGLTSRQGRRAFGRLSPAFEKWRNSVK